MRILGISGGQVGTASHDLPSKIPFSPFGHDAAAVLLEDGQLVAAIEEERLDRVKHSIGFPVQAIRACLAMRGLEIGDIDAIAYSTSRSGLRWTLADEALRQNAQGGEPLEMDPAAFLRGVVHRTLGQTVGAEKLRFVKHHLAHAAAAFWPSGFDRALVVTLDGRGEREAGNVLVGDGNVLRQLESFSDAQSLGVFYSSVITLIGFTFFDEYKAMGLAPYGNPDVWFRHFNKLYELHPEGKYVLHMSRLNALAGLLEPRRRSQPFTQQHKDVAAGLQKALEEIAFHVISHAQKQTGLRKLCLGGGVAHNCTLNGKLRASGLFDDVFVQPAAHDAGNALGAALLVHCANGVARPQRVTHVYLGRDIGDEEAIESGCRRWSGFVDVRRSGDVEEEAAELLANGQIIGWVQGRSEFGPRALGNRSILADPRPAENKRLINAMVKKREGFRPFAPAVVEEAAHEYFDVGGRSDLPFMTFVLGVKPDKQPLLGAICHVDGSARVQTVSRSSNARFWSLINAFGKRTGVPIVLNTSFNNNAEPIVDSIDDAIVCYLTTGLNVLVIGDFILERKSVPKADHGTLVARVPPQVYLSEIVHHERDGTRTRVRTLRRTTGLIPVAVDLSERAYRTLERADGRLTLSELAAGAGVALDDALLDEFVELWGKRLVRLLPAD